MKIYHQLGHNYKWALDAHFQNSIGDGFIFSAYTFKYGSVGNSVSSYGPSQYLGKSMIDLQFYGSKDSVGGSLDSYPFNPATLEPDDHTLVKGSELMMKGVQYQISLGLTSVIVPMVYCGHTDIEETLTYLARANKRIVSIKKHNPDIKFFMTVPFGNGAIMDDEKVEMALQAMTDINICFDGYYIVCDYSPEYKKKISIDYDYYANLLKVFSVLHDQGFETIYGYANWDALVFNALTNINYTTIGTYENLRRFNIKRFTESAGGGPSKGWYFSEKLLNFIRAEEIKSLRKAGCLGLIANEENIFSDVILKPTYIWNTHKPEVHKNYLVSISKLLTQLHGEKDLNKRAALLLKRIETARALYEALATDFRVYLNDENSDYHLGMWSSFLRRNTTR